MSWKIPPATNFWPSMRDRPFCNRDRDMMIQREPDAPEVGSRYITIPNPDYKPAKYFEYEDDLAHWESCYLPEAQRGKKPVAPEPPFQPKSDAEFKKVLLDHGVTTNPITNYDYSAKKPSDNKVTTKNEPGSAVAGSNAVMAANTKEDPADLIQTRKKIYAKKIYGIEYADFTEQKFIKAARIDLGIDDKSKLIPKDERKKNFELFKENHFSNSSDDTMQPYSGSTPKGTPAYDKIRDYALSSYGALMVKKVLTVTKSPKFIIGVEDGSHARGEALRNLIILPPNFPSLEYFEISKQKILGVAIIHHEFEHTQYGEYDNPKSIKEERLAVRYKENPVRIINGLEPRYVYYDYNTEGTINILTKEKQKGQWTFDKNDPRMMIRVK